MKSNVCEIKQDVTDLSAIFVEVEKASAYNGLEGKDALHLRLLTEELIGMLPELFEHRNGSFWIENDDKKYELHVCVQAQSRTIESDDRLLSVSTSGKNAAHKGIMGKIRAAAEIMLYPVEFNPFDYELMDMGAFVMPGAYTSSWTLRQYMNSVQNEEGGKKNEAWDELEKSIIANLADDVVVGIRGKQVDIIVKKAF